MFIRYIHFMLVKTIDKVPARFKLERKEFNSVVNSNSQKRWISVVKINTAISYTSFIFFSAFKQLGLYNFWLEPSTLNSGQSSTSWDLRYMIIFSFKITKLYHPIVSRA